MIGRTTLSLALALLAVCGASACMSVPAGTSLEAATPAPVSLARGAWLAPATISDPKAKEAAEIQRGLTLAIANYASDSKYFARVNQLPGEPRSDELILRFDFDRYQLRRTTHPAYFPAALLTLTLYIWFGGPIQRDMASLSGSLRVEDTAGRELVSVRDHFEDTHNVNFYSPDYIFPSGMKSRTALVRALLDQAVGTLSRAGLSTTH